MRIINTLALLSTPLILPVVSEDPSAIFPLSSNTEFSFVLETVLSLSNNQGAQTGEVLRAASQIVPNDFESWYKEFLFLGDSIHAKAAAINASRFPASARSAYFRSSTYYRFAPFFLHANASDPRINEIGARSVADFDKAAALLPRPAIKANLSASSPNVPNEHFSVPVRFFEGQSVKKRLPTIIVGTGYDGTQEDLFHEMGVEILARGWNVITYEGPGQPTVLREQNLGFIPDWWNVVTPIVDYLATRCDVEMNQVALVGISFGGQLAPLAASHEPRLSAVLSIDGLSDMYSVFASQFPSTLLDLYNNGHYAEFDEALLATIHNTSVPTQLRWILAQSLFSFNTDSPSDWWRRLPAFAANETVLHHIKYPAFIGKGEDDSSAPSQPEEMIKWLGNKGTFNLFRTDLGAGEHCQIGAEAQLTQVTLDWLADVWDHVTLPANLTSGTY
ncbi:Alpha/Beta hydrolase protein [Penicillium lagena]|uniref:Alpha/Beta hydrolase protein n=1 Tax=Penicillium lagena TaxID=94218 RepID=UPI0025417B65|nr:Alpha/Beta hydrolase protein [Penicillium lagena]KAJ5610938.1 Alpha/Beta hydrolase protein [Penicillium lagena]